MKYDKKEYILCAAFWFKDFDAPVHNARNLTEGVVMCGWRHGNIVGQHNSLLGKRQAEMGDWEDGFMTSKGNFVGREEAGKIAFEAKQTDKLIQTLYSEDLY